MYYSVLIDNHSFATLCLRPRLSLLHRLGSYFIVFSWLAPNNTIRFFSWVLSCFKLTRCNLNLISREAEARILCCMLRSAMDITLPLNFAVFHACIFVYSSFWRKQPIMQIQFKSNPFSRFQMAFSLSSFSVCCALCVFLINQVKLQAMHHSVSSVSRKWMVTWRFTGGFCIPFPLRTATMREQASRGEQQRKKSDLESPLRN